MRILLDECMPYPLIARLARSSIGDVYGYAVHAFDLFITNDRYFRNPNRFPACPTMGIVMCKLAPVYR